MNWKIDQKKIPTMEHNNKKVEHIYKESKDTIGSANIHLFGISEGRDSAKAMFEEIMVENIHKMMKGI